MYCFDVKTIVLVGMIMMSQIAELSFLFDRRLNKAKYLRYIMLAGLIFWCLFSLIFGGFVERGYAAMTLIGTTAVEVLVRRRNRAAQS